MNPSTILSTLSFSVPRGFAQSLFVPLLALLLLPSPLVHAQTGAGALLAGQREAEPRILKLGEPIERELSGGQSHTYQLTLSAGQFLHAVVEQRGIDVAVTLFGPDGKKLIEVDSQNGAQGPEPVKWIVQAAGLYQIDVRSLESKAKPGRYEIKLIELRAPTNQDRDLVAADQAYREAESLSSKGQFNQAIPLAERSLAGREKALGAEHEDVALALNLLAILYYAGADFARAEPLFRRALALFEKLRGDQDQYVATVINNLASLYMAKGDYTQAEPLFRRALAVKEKEFGLEHPQTINSLNNLAGLYRSKGDYAQAEPLYRRALAVAEKSLGAGHPNAGLLLQGLGMLYAAQNDYTQAEPLFRRALAIFEKAVGAEHPANALPLGSLASLYRVKGDYAQAELFSRRALAIFEKVLGNEHADVAISLDNLAMIYLDKGDYTQAEPLFQRALAIFEKSLGAQHPSTARSLNNLAGFYETRGDVGRAVNLRARAQEIEERNIALNLAAGSERQKLAYLKTLAKETGHSIGLHVRLASTDAAARDLALTAILQRKGRVLEALNDGLEALRRRAAPQDRALLDQLKEARAQLARLVLSGQQRVSAAEHRQALKHWEENVEKLEAEISNRSAEFRMQAQPVTIAAVQAAIPSDAALIEFYRYDYRQESRYVAYILRQRGEAQWIELGEAQAVDDTVNKLRQALRDKTRADVKQLARAVDEKVMQPVRALLGKTRRVLIAPDGALNLLPFAALMDEKGHYLVRHFEFSYLTSGRDLLRLQIEHPHKQAALVVASPDFGDEVNTDNARERILTYRPGAKAETSDGGVLTAYYFPPLDGTSGEAQALKVMMTDATVLTQAQATEAALKQVSSPRILHIATHGFFLEDQKPVAGEERLLRPVGGEMLPLGRIENPLLRSGLALAGANRLKSGDDDGILTAQEAAGLDLWGTKLVVLSACDTGVGEVKNGEGVYGLRRALVLAGSETQVMSLWPVSDKATRDLMIEYYRRLLKGEGRSAALRAVQLQMLKAKAAVDDDEDRLLVAKSQQDKDRILKTKNGKKSGEKAAPKDYSHPYYWASFIQSGEWANLDGKR